MITLIGNLKSSKFNFFYAHRGKLLDSVSVLIPLIPVRTSESLFSSLVTSKGYHRLLTDINPKT